MVYGSSTHHTRNVGEVVLQRLDGVPRISPRSDVCSRGGFAVLSSQHKVKGADEGLAAADGGMGVDHVLDAVNGGLGGAFRSRREDAETYAARVQQTHHVMEARAWHVGDCDHCTRACALTCTLNLQEVDVTKTQT